MRGALKAPSAQPADAACASVHMADAATVTEPATHSAASVPPRGLPPAIVAGRSAGPWGVRSFKALVMGLPLLTTFSAAVRNLPA